jgi:hypothetical protein
MRKYGNVSVNYLRHYYATTIDCQEASFQGEVVLATSSQRKDNSVNDTQRFSEVLVVFIFVYIYIYIYIYIYR